MTDPLLVETVGLDGMWRVPDDRAGDARRYRIAWFDPPFRPPLEDATQASELRHSRLVLLDRVAHFPYWEAPETLQSLLRDVLAAPSPRDGSSV